MLNRHSPQICCRISACIFFSTKNASRCERDKALHQGGGGALGNPVSQFPQRPFDSSREKEVKRMAMSC